MSLSKKAYTSVQRVVRNRTLKVNLSSIWREVHEELGVGELSSNYLTLSTEDHVKLRAWAVQEAGADPLNTDITGNRLQAAALVRNEKWATESVFSGLLKVNRRSRAIPLTQGDAITPPGTLLDIDASDILVDRLDTVVLVENGIIARHWHQCRTPETVADALMVYRGHGDDSMKCVRQWLEHLPSTVLKVGHLDFDPAGLGIAIDYGLDAILIPDPLNDRLLEGINNKPEDHDKQLASRPDLGDQLPGPCRDVWSWMTSDNRKCAVTQERLLVMDWSLRLLPLT